MIKILLFDFSRVLLWSKDKGYDDGLNALYKEIKDLPDFSFFDHFEINSELLEYLKEIKGKIKLYIFTKGSIQETPEVAPYIKDIFIEIFSADKIGYLKEDENAYTFLANKLNTQPAEILFIDDNMDNINAATRAGLQTFQYNENETLIRKIDEIISDQA